MGRKEGEELSAAQIFYPAMQAADVFFLKADICQLGMDQRKVNVLAREYCDAAEPKIKHKPIILSHHMMAGLKEGQEKMSKSDPDSAIFMEDSEADVKRKIRQAFCPAGVVEGNPVLDWVKYIVFAKWGSMTIKRKPENGGDKCVFQSWWCSVVAVEVMMTPPPPQPPYCCRSSPALAPAGRTRRLRSSWRSSCPARCTRVTSRRH